jgi:uroporphyrinogen decarboxylase
VIGSVGPTTSEVLREYGWPVDLEPEHPKMGPLVALAAQRSREILDRKQRLRSSVLQPGGGGPASTLVRQPFHESLPPRAVRCGARLADASSRTLHGRVPRGPAKTTFLELCKDPALCSEVMCTAVRRLGVDAAIIFSDLLPILEPMGLDLEFAQGEGPVIHNPVREGADVDRVLELESVDSLDFVTETVRQTRRDLPPHLPLIGFAGAPFTLASYVIEGGSSRNYHHTKTLMYRDAGAWRTLMERFARAVTRYLNAQVAAGAQCVQLFDSWAGCLGPDDYRIYVLPYVREIIAGSRPASP